MNNSLLVVFDLDGTLIDSRAEIAEATNITRREFGLSPAKPEELKAWFGLHPTRFFDDLHRSGDLQDAIAVFRSNLQHLHGGTARFFDDCPQALKDLHGHGVTLAIATTKPTHLAEDLVNTNSVSKYISAIQGTDGFQAKPNPEVFFRLEEKLAPGQFAKKISVGDRLEDARAGTGAGYKAVAIRRNYFDPSEYSYKESGATHVITDLNELIELVTG